MVTQRELSNGWTTDMVQINDSFVACISNEKASVKNNQVSLLHIARTNKTVYIKLIKVET